MFINKAYTQLLFEYPAYNGEPTVDTIFGKEVIDDYIDFENYKKNKKVISYYEKQEDLSEKYFKQQKIASKYANYLRRIDKNENDRLYDIKLSQNGAIFIHKTIKGKYRSQVFYKSSIDSEEIVLYSPKSSDKRLRDRHKISRFQPSWDGKKVAIGIRNNNSFASEIIVIDVATKKVQETGIINTRPKEYWDFNWIPGTYSFTYTSIRTTDPEDSNTSINTSLEIYDIEKGTSKAVFGNGIGPKIDERLIPLTRIHSPDDKYLIVYVAGPSRYWDSYYTSFESLKNGEPKWKPFFKISDKSYLGRAQLRNNQLYYLAGKNNRNHSLSLLDLKTNEHKVLVPAFEEEVMKDIQLIDGGISFTTLKNGTSAKAYTFINDSLHKLNLPIKAASISLSQQPSNKKNLYLDIENLLSSNRRLKYDITTKSFNEEYLYKAANIPEFKDITYSIIDVPSHDGVMIPMTIVHKKDIALTGNIPVFSYSYGAFGTIIGTSFRTQHLAFVGLGGVVVYPHIRGGGAKGEKWHEAGMKTTKPNSWKDLIACMEYLVAEGYTKHEKITLYGASAGALPVAMAVNEKPELAGAIILRSGVLNPLRRFDKNGKNSFVEYGDIEKPDEAMGLIAMDSYLNIPDKAKLPAIYVHQSMKDNRVYLHEPLKYVAKAQQSSINDKPILFDIDYYGTHQSPDNFYDYYGRVFAFSFDHTGFKPDF